MEEINACGQDKHVYMEEINTYVEQLNTSEAYVAVMGDQVPVIRFRVLDKIPWLTHGFSTRGGGVSKGDFASMNLSFTRGDDPKDAMENFRRFGQAIGIAPEEMILTHQTHTTCVRPVGRAEGGKGILFPRDEDGVDGFITDEPGAAIVTFFADCVPLFFVDVKKKVIGSSHSGWRGTVGRMGQATVRAMKEHYGCDPKDLVAVIGPSICGNCYEVSGDVAEAFAREFSKNQCEDFLKNKGNGKYLLDLWKANVYILQDAGIPRENIHVSGLCTHCHPDLLWSHRSQGTKRGSLAGFIMKSRKGIPLCREGARQK